MGHLDGVKRFRFVGCKVLQREAYYCAARSGNVVDIDLMQQGLHNEPDTLRSTVQEAIGVTEDLEGRAYDAILLGYGMCSNGIVGLQAEVPIVVPRAHDCAALLLGSHETYQEYFDSHRGVYWYSGGWIDTSTMPGEERLKKQYEEYVAKFGEDNAKYLMEVEQSWIKEYERATYIDWGFPNSEKEKAFTRKCAEFLGWEYDEVKGDSGLLQRLFDGQWNEKEFLVVEPGKKIEEDLAGGGLIGSG